MTTEKMLTPKEAARILRVSDWTVRKYIREGRLTAYRIGNGSRHHLRISRYDLDVFIKDGKINAN